MRTIVIRQRAFAWKVQFSDDGATLVPMSVDISERFWDGSVHERTVWTVEYGSPWSECVMAKWAISTALNAVEGHPLPKSVVCKSLTSGQKPPHCLTSDATQTVSGS